VWTSMNPGLTTSPAPSITVRAGSVVWPSSAIRPDVTATSAV